MPNIDRITSPSNAFVKDLKRASGRSSLTESGCSLAEGFHLLHEAMQSSAGIDTVVVSSSSLDRLPELPGRVRVVELPDALFQSVAATETSQGILTLVRMPTWTERDIAKPPALAVVLDGLQDPGNVGTIFRAAEAFGASGIILGTGTAKPENPKTLRASAGSLFRVPHVALSLWRPQNIQLYAAVPYAPGVKPAREVDWTRPCGIVIGSEGRGLSEAYSKIAPVAIPTRGVESLNAAIAASILLYEAHSQRHGAK